MKIGELIARLERYDPKVEVALADWSEDAVPPLLGWTEMGLNQWQSYNEEQQKDVHVSGLVFEPSNDLIPIGTTVTTSDLVLPVKK